jgi:crossover junction endodeoxyribonuclease RuvC
VRYVGIDQSYTGFAVVAIDAEGIVVHEDVTKFEAKSHGSGIDRLIGIYGHLFAVLHEIDDVGQVCMEGYSAASKFGREAAGELGAMVKMAIYDYFDQLVPKTVDEADLRYPAIVQPGSLKKFVTGNGAAKKNNMMLAVYKKWGYEPHNDDLADAYSLARVALALDIGADLAYEKEALKSVHRHTEMPPATIPSP